MLAGYFGELIKERALHHERINIALSGGSTPKAIFDELAEKYASVIRWERVFLFWGDERCVPPDDAQSNYNMTKEHLLSKVPIPKENVFRVKGEKEPSVACMDYEEVLKKQLTWTEGVPQFDMVLLGMGDDGHTASIFPHEIGLWNAQANCVVATHPQSGQKRISLSGKVINHSKEVFFLVTGAGKAEKLDEIIHQKEACTSYPAALVVNPVWLLDKEAAAKLT
ncbi:6-phosphogluconolactonase [Saccharicrinis fermentans]|uniref:6-phosphogluconolactonase n=2 Tax=Saccharicrinis fermentans TaxID=982 RepID=W7YL07_9BACT|nr:6-phosphogluconolactonase [Saccharicrinis fermentans]GAF03044.1 6-phosphogluconolactonase [Saccharicrinis fermentans DSM 9555 = JCM 21142]